MIIQINNGLSYLLLIVTKRDIITFRNEFFGYQNKNKYNKEIFGTLGYNYSLHRKLISINI